MAGDARRATERELLRAALTEARSKLKEAQERGAGATGVRLLTDRVAAARRQLDALERRAG
jgi:tRNA(Arg) A34 adenosine deaminase TadA